MLEQVLGVMFVDLLLFFNVHSFLFICSLFRQEQSKWKWLKIPGVLVSDLVFGSGEQDHVLKN